MRDVPPGPTGAHADPPAAAAVAGSPPALPDAHARHRVVTDLDTNLLVEAGAGSGKTTALVHRMLALVETGAARADELAAVTFTRKAAGELRERFQNGLEERIAGAAPGDSALPLLHTALLDVDRAFIGTIHAFCARLLRERPLEARLDPGFREVLPHELLRIGNRFWEGFLERRAAAGDPALAALIDAGLRPHQVRDLFRKVVDNPDVTFPAEGMERPSPEEVAALRGELERILDRAGALLPRQEPESGWDRLQEKLRALRFSRFVLGWTSDAHFFDALAEVCPRKGFSRVFKRWPPGSREQVRALGEAMDEVAREGGGAHRLLTRWWAYRYPVALGLARAAAEEFGAHRRQTGLLGFQDLLVLTADLLRRSPRARRDLGRRYRRLLVDEFQDTDPIQAEVLLLLASEPEEGGEGESGDSRATGASPEAGERHMAQGTGRDGAADWRRSVPRPGALFVVGDPKQSIYRFRRADIAVYAQVKERFQTFGDVVELTANFRSRTPVATLVNRLFGGLGEGAEEGSAAAPSAASPSMAGGAGEAPEARGTGLFPAAATAYQAAFAPLVPVRTDPAVAPEGIFLYDVDPAATNRDAVAEDDALRLASWIHRRIRAGERAPGDFLVLTRTRRSLDRYAAALEARNVPVQVTGAGVGVERELRELILLLETLADPGDEVRTAAVLLGLFFGVDHDALVDHALAGRSPGGGRRGTPFDFTRERTGPDLGPVDRALNRLHRWWRKARREPADIMVGRLAAELGLLPLAASGELSSVRAGALLYVLDAVRAAALEGDTSLTGALEALSLAVELQEAEAPLEPGRADVVRVMNLHQAKGLEAPVVILADPSGEWDPPVEDHVERSPEGRPVGWARLEEQRDGWGGNRILARPPAWEEKEAEEKRFAQAEGRRLLYVAATRARDELVVSRNPAAPDKSPWRALETVAQRVGEVLADVVPEPPPHRERLERSPGDVRDQVRGVEVARAVRARPTYAFEAVTDVAKGRRTEEAAEIPDLPGDEAAAEGARRSGDPLPPPFDPTAFRGHAWGSAVHGALAAAAEGATGVELERIARALLLENERPLDPAGEPEELAELVNLVEALAASPIWRRAMAAERRLVEVPFALPGGVGEEPVGTAGLEGHGGDAGPQIDLFGRPEGTWQAASPSGAEGSSLRVLEGVVDLAFREPDGWVVVDWKTDAGTDAGFARRRETYRRQVDLYSRAWETLTGERVKERVLVFTAMGTVEAVHPRSG